MRGRVGPRELERLREDLSGRDRAIVQTVTDARLMSGRQLQVLFFPIEEHATARTAARCARRVLERLSRDRLLVRLERRIGGVRAGSASFVYALGPVGQRLLMQPGPRRRLREPSGYFVAHTLAVSELVVELTTASRRGVVELTTASRRGVVELLQLQHEPGCWRTFGGLGVSQLLRPDLFVVLGVGDYEHRWFIEVDRGSESLPVVLRKCRTYEAYYASGVEQAEHGVFPHVLWIVPDSIRAERLRTTIDAEASRLTPGLFSVTTTDEAMAVLKGGAS